jgi:topoisomerase-4 subunit A
VSSKSSSGRSARRIQQIAFETELGLSFGRYAEKVILDRAIPDIRDGLKPVQRRIIYAMYDSGNRPDKPYRKAAKTVGDVMGNYHPHGDSAIYDALVRLSQPWKMRYPLIDGHGNFGSMDDDPAAAMRYTEARLSSFALDLCSDIDKDTVAWRPNFDEKTLEPIVLPAGYLNLLCNGTSGVSAGFATEIPSHNLTEVVDGCLAYLENPAITVAEVMTHIKGPDFPTGGVLMGADGIVEAYETGRGKVTLRGRYTIEKQRDGKHLIAFTEIPFHVIKADLVRQMDAIRLDKQVQGVHDVRDESGREGLRVVIEVGKNADPEGILAYFLKKTPLQVNYHFNMVTIHRNTPRQVGILPILKSFIEHRREVVTRRTQHDLDKAATRLHEVDGLIKAVDILDEVIATIRASQDRADARTNLMAMDFTAAQADAILDLRLARLTNLQLLSLTDEAMALRKLIKGLRKILDNPSVCDSVVAREITDVRDRHGDERRTTIEAEFVEREVDLAVTVRAQDVVVGVTDQGWIKRASLASYSASGGNRLGSGVRPGDRMHDVVFTNTRHEMIILTGQGVCYPLSVYKIPEYKWGDMGTALVNVCRIAKDDEVVTTYSHSKAPAGLHVVFVTVQGLIKATPLDDFVGTRPSGLLAMRIADGDRLSKALITPLEGDLLLLSRRGKGVRFGLDQVSVQGRSARGVRGMKLEPTDEIADAVIVPVDSDETHKLTVAVFTREGSMKRSLLNQHPLQRRGGKGLNFIVHRARKPHDCLSVHVCGPRDSFEVVDTDGVELPLAASKIPVTVREGKGFNPLALKRGVQIALVAYVPWKPEGDGTGGSDGDDEDGPHGDVSGDVTDPEDGHEASAEAIPEAEPEPSTPKKSKAKTSVKKQKVANSGREAQDTVQDIEAAPDPEATQPEPSSSSNASTADVGQGPETSAAFRNVRAALEDIEGNVQARLPGLDD